jgi:hypothetical protein
MFCACHIPVRSRHLLIHASVTALSGTASGATTSGGNGFVQSQHGYHAYPRQPYCHRVPHHQQVSSTCRKLLVSPTILNLVCPGIATTSCGPNGPPPKNTKTQTTATQIAARILRSITKMPLRLKSIRGSKYCLSKLAVALIGQRSVGAPGA